MESRLFPSLKGLQRPFFIFLCAGLLVLVYWAYGTLTEFQAANRTPNLPFGVFSISNGGVYTQDFAYNMLYFKGIQERLVPRPYRLEDQEKLMRQMVPGSTSGLSHAYSPVAFVLALPLLCVSGANGYLIYTILSTIGILLLFYFYLLPRTVDPLQHYALAICAASVCLITAFVVGQSALVTTSLLGAFWGLLRKRSVAPSLLLDFLIAVFFWSLCLKPSVAIIPFTLLLGARAWRATILGGVLLLITWLVVAPYYGGWWIGLADYAFLLNHYHNADMTAFMQRGSETSHQKDVTLHLFSLNRACIFIAIPVLCLLQWTRRITASEQFQGVIWAFLLFSPYLMPSENWIMCLLVVEGPFFHFKSWPAACGKLALLFCILNLRAGLTFPVDINFPLKCLLLAWIIVERFQAGKQISPSSLQRPLQKSCS